MAIKALACELPAKTGVPLSRWSTRELAAQAVRSGLVAQISGTTIWRWLSEDAIRPWHFRSWIFPRDPKFAEKAGRILDLYAGSWQGESLTEDDFVISTDEKTSIQARLRCHATRAPRPCSPMRVEHEYERGGAWAYWAAWDVFRAKIFGLCSATTGLEPFGQLVDQVMAQPPYRTARRVFWIADNGSSHRGDRAIARLAARYPNAILVHTPVHASWLNQVEIYFSIIQRKVLTPNDFSRLDEVATRLAAFERHYEAAARPFQWTFTRSDLAALLLRLSAAQREPPATLAAAA